MIIIIINYSFWTFGTDGGGRFLWYRQRFPISHLPFFFFFLKRQHLTYKDVGSDLLYKHNTTFQVDSMNLQGTIMTFYTRHGLNTS